MDMRALRALLVFLGLMILVALYRVTGTMSIGRRTSNNGRSRRRCKS